MTFRERLKDPEAMARIAAMFLAIALVMQYFPYPHATTTAVQYLAAGVRGLMFGLSIGLNLKAARMIARQRRIGSS